MIKIIVDSEEVGNTVRMAKNDVRVVIPLDAIGRNKESNPYERHITVTHEGIVVDIVVGGEVMETVSFEHHDLFDWDPA